MCSLIGFTSILNMTLNRVINIDFAVFLYLDVEIFQNWVVSL